MLRIDSGDSARSIGSAAVARATVALSAVLTVGLAGGCTGKSSGAGATPTTPPAGASTSASPDTIGQDATASLHGSATISMSGASPVTVTAVRSQPVTLELSPSGAATIDLSMRSGASALFSLSGPARTGAAVRTDHVAILLTASGVLVNTASGNPCQASYDVVSESKVGGTVTCQALRGGQKVPVTVHFSAS